MRERTVLGVADFPFSSPFVHTLEPTHIIREANPEPCEVCNAPKFNTGYYSLAGSGKCTKCDAGTYGGCKGVACTVSSCAGKCPIGHFCLPGTLTIKDAEKCPNEDGKTAHNDTYACREGSVSCTPCANRCSPCHDCTRTGACKVLNDKCVVNNKCYNNGDVDPKTSCMICNRLGANAVVGRCPPISVSGHVHCALSLWNC